MTRLYYPDPSRLTFDALVTRSEPAPASHPGAFAVWLSESAFYPTTGGQQGKFIQAKRFYSGTEMARMSKDELDAWKKLPRLDRVRQLCNSEEKLQFGHELRAVGFINSALSPAMRSEAGMYGDGFAVQTPKGWQHVQFKCQVDDDALRVVAFSYAVKGRIPASQLEKLGVPSN